MFLAKAASLLFLFASGVWAQSETAQCRPGYAWVCAMTSFRTRIGGRGVTAQCSDRFLYGFLQNQNSLDQDPCTVGSTLDASCRGLRESTRREYLSCRF